MIRAVFIPKFGQRAHMNTTHTITPLHADRLRWPTLALLAFALVGMAHLATVHAATVDFHARHHLAGKALLTDPGFVVKRELGVANFAPEMRMPVELVYKSNSEKPGAFEPIEAA